MHQVVQNVSPLTKEQGSRGLLCFPHLFTPEKATWLPDQPALALSRRETCLAYSDVTYWHVEAVGMEK